MKRLAALLLFLTCLGVAPAHANCTAPCTKAQVTADINTNWPDNTTQSITPALLRSTVLDLVNSYMDINGAASFTCGANLFMTSIASLSSYGCTQPAFSNLSGTVGSAQLAPPYTLPNTAAPGTPAAGNVVFWADSTDITLHSKNSAGTIGTMVVPLPGSGNNFVLGLSNAGGLATSTAVTGVTPGGGLVSSTVAACSQTAISNTGTLSRADCIDAQTGTTYAIPDSDRGKIITASNAAAQAYSIAAATGSGAFFAGWTTFIENNSPADAGIVTITPTTSQICSQGVCAATYKIQPGQFARITSDGTNYQVTENVVSGQIPGVTNGGNANAGGVGEYLETVVAVGSAVSLVTATPKDITSLTLTAGDWDVSGSIEFVTAATTNVSGTYASISTTLNNFDATNGRIAGGLFTAFVPGASNQAIANPIGPLRFNVTTNTTVHLVAVANFTVSTLTGYGLIRARRMR